jgi:hypothetical protein
MLGSDGSARPFDAVLALVKSAVAHAGVPHQDDYHEPYDEIKA